MAYAKASAADSKAEPVAPTGLVPLELGKAIPVSVTAPAKVTSFKLLYLREIGFQLSKKSHLVAKIATSETQGLTDLPPIIIYTVHAAVFDANGKLLGTANTSRKLSPRVTVGAVMMVFREISMDFGVSLNYDKAKFFALAISEPEIKVANKSGKDPAPVDKQ